jgi:hypothetical protein
LLLTPLAVTQASASDWTNTGTGDWFDPLNWSAGIPDLGAWVTIDNGGNPTVSAGLAQVQTVRVGDSNAGTLTLTGGELIVDEWMNLGIGPGSTGLLDIQGGKLAINELSIQGNGTGRISMSGGTLAVEGGIGVGNGVFEHTGGVVTGFPNDGSPPLIGVSVDGLYSLSGTGQIDWGRIAVYGGRATLSGDAVANVSPSASVSGGGVLTLHDNATMHIVNRLRVGATEGNGTFVQTGGLLAGHMLQVASNQPGNNVATIDGGTTRIEQVLVGSTRDGTDTLAINGVAMHSDFRISSDIAAGVSNTALLDATNADLSGVLTVRASRGNAIARQTGGTAVWSKLRVYGNQTQGPLGIYEVNDTQITVTDTLMADTDFTSRGVIDFNNSSSSLTMGPGSYADLTKLDLINTANASLVFSDEMLVRIAPGETPGAGLGSYQPNNAVFHEAGTTLVVGVGQSLRLRPDLQIAEPVVVKGLVRDHYKHGSQLQGGLIVDGGFVRLDDRSQALIWEANGSGVFNNGLLELREINFRGEDAVVFTLDSGVAKISKRIDLSGGVFQINSGKLSTPELIQSFRAGQPATVLQQGGQVDLERLEVTDYQLSAGELVTQTVTFSGGSRDPGGQFTQSGGTHRTQSLGLNDIDRYVYTGGQLVIENGYMVMRDEAVFDFGDSGTTLVLDRSVLEMTGTDAKFAGGGQATLALDEHSLLIVPTDYVPDVAKLQHAGLTWDGVGTLIVPAGRDIAFAEGGTTGLLDVRGTVRAIPGERLDNFEVNGGFLDLTASGSGIAIDNSPTINSGTINARFFNLETSSPRTFVHNGGDVTFHSFRLIGAGNTYQLNQGMLRIEGYADIRGGELISNGGPSQLVAGSGAHIDFFLNPDPAQLGNMDLIVEPDALVTFAPGFDYNNAFKSVNNQGLIHLDGTPLVIPEDTRITAGYYIDGDVVLNGTLASHQFGSNSGASVKIDGDLIFTDTSVLEVAMFWRDFSDEPRQSRYRLETDPGKRISIDGALRIILTEQMWFEGDEEILILSGALFDGAFNDGAERVFTEGGEGSFTIEYREGEGVFLTNYMDFAPALGDLNADGVVDDADAQIIRDNFGRMVPAGNGALGDWNGDGLVDRFDAEAVLTGWSDGAPPDNIPEPSSLALLIWSFLGLMWCRCAKPFSTDRMALIRE